MEREHDFQIGPSRNDPYMLRWWVIPRNPIFNIYLHKILHDDDDSALHDHPWASLSFMVEGELVEHYKAIDSDCARKRILKAGQWVYRKAKFAHRLQLKSDQCVTVFITGPKIRDWGFHCPKGWVPWRDFVSKTDKGSIGRGCGEN